MSRADHARPVIAAALVLLALAVAGCSDDGENGSASGSDDPPVVCSAVDALETSVATVTSVDLDRGALPELGDNLAQVQSDLREVREAAKEEYVTEIYAVDLAAGAVGSSLTAAIEGPSREAIADIGTGVQQLGDTLASLQEAIASTC